MIGETFLQENPWCWGLPEGALGVSSFLLPTQNLEEIQRENLINKRQISLRATDLGTLRLKISEAVMSSLTLRGRGVVYFPHLVSKL